MFSGVPLRHRLPNPPALFVGRERETTWLTDAVKRAPVTVVHGPGGLGKTVLFLHTLHKRFARRVSRILFVPVRTGASAEEILQQVLGALTEARGEGEIDWEAIQGDVEALTAEVIDAAESGPWWVLLDDLHHGEPYDVENLLGRLARYARKSRWMITTRMDPRITEPSVMSLGLGAMAAEELESLARSWGAPPAAPSDDLLTRAVHVAAGSPWLLQQCLATGRAEPAFTREDLLGGLSTSAGQLLEVLSVLEVALPEELIARMVPLPSAEERAELVRRGLVEHRAEGLRAHEVVRGVLQAPGAGGDAARWRRVAGPILLKTEASAIAVEGVRLLLDDSQIDEVVAFLDERAERLIETGYAPRLWKLLEPRADERLAGWRVRCATALGNPTALYKVQQPRGATPQERVEWAHTLFMQGQIEDARAIAEEIREQAREPRDRFEGGLLAARCLAVRGDTVAAKRELEGVPTPDADAVARRDAALAMLLGGTPAGAEAAALGDALRRDLGELSVSTQREVAFGAAYGYRAEGKLTDASGLLRTVQTSPTGSLLHHFEARRALWLRAVIQLDRGDLAGAQQSLERLEPYLRGPSLLRPYVMATQITLQIAQGRLDDLERILADVRQEAVLFATGDCLLEVHALHVHLASLRAEREERLEPPGASTREAELLHLRQVEHLVLRGDHPPAASLERIAEQAGRGIRPLCRAVLARVALLRGDPHTALSEASQGVRDANESGHRLRAAEARQVQCEILVELGRTVELAAAARELRALAEQLPSARFAFEAELLEMLAADEPDLAELEDIAGRPDVAPAASRRARLLLGGEPAHDALDARLVERVRQRPGWRAPQLVSELPPSESGQWHVGWGLDEPHRRVWLPGGRWIDFSKRPLHWRILEAIAAHGGTASKEEIVLAVWEEPEYHPLRHDTRLQVAVRKLRELLEDTPSEPRRLVTTEDGYAFEGQVRRLCMAC